MNRKLRILVSPLNWGLGHATRLIPVIRYYLHEGHEVILAGEGDSLSLLRQEFPQLEWHPLPCFSPRFSPGSHQVWTITRQIPRFLYMIWLEHRITRQLIHKLRVQAIISDNRYGVRHPRCKSVIITHQLAPHLDVKRKKFFEWFVSLALDVLVSKFDHCWVPDLQEAVGLSGDLATSVIRLRNVHRIGMLSRFSVSDEKTSPGGPAVALVSGPEPQRSIFEAKLIRYFEEHHEEAIIIRGKPQLQNPVERRGKILMLSHCSTDEFSIYVRSARYIICRSGYSTIMDLMVLGRRALLVPTPGQPEQEYLADHLQLFDFRSSTQNDFQYIPPVQLMGSLSKTFAPQSGFRGFTLVAPHVPQ